MFVGVWRASQYAQCHFHKLGETARAQRSALAIKQKIKPFVEDKNNSGNQIFEWKANAPDQKPLSFTKSSSCQRCKLLGIEPTEHEKPRPESTAQKLSAMRRQDFRVFCVIKRDSSPVIGRDCFDIESDSP